MKKSIGVLAHVDAGKTTFCEQILYHTNSIRSRGRVDHKNAYLDSHDIERERGITIFSDQGVFTYNNSTYYLIDTPGHADFSSEMERAVQVMDYAIIIISAVEGVQGHTETVWQLIRNRKIPVFFFINKADRAGADINNVILEISLKLTGDVLYVNESAKADGFPGKNIMEFMAERDDSLLEKYLNGDFEGGSWVVSLRNMVKEGRVFPCMSGSALQDDGIIEFLELLENLTFTEYDPASEFGGRVFKIRHDEQGSRVTYIKAISGKLTVRDNLPYGAAGDMDERPANKINQIRIYNGSKFKTVDSVSAGDVFAVTGLANAEAGDGVGAITEKSAYKMIPALKSRVIPDDSMSIREVLGRLKLLEAEDPALNITWDERLQEIHVNIMGVIQLEVLKEIISKRFSFKVEFGPCQVLYKETVTIPSIGYGHFEPLKHYAEVHLKIEPANRDSGISFNSVCHVDSLLPGFQNLIRYHIFEREHRGILTGSVITDIEITLLTGRAHQKHTSGGDFREATLRALRQGLEKAGCILLEPFYRFRIEVETDSMGRVLSDIQKMHGEFEAPETLTGKVLIIGRGPVATFMNYSAELISFTKGKGSITMSFEGYDRCHNETEVIEKIGYNREADPEYTSKSIFCSHGAGFTVEGSKAEEYMHCLS
ncbi:MAG TPA: translation factor GTPase family protein [Ruminiclostridium sp.]|nr:translation factor GTPase family protein [Ruminiclostridium sp.]